MFLGRFNHALDDKGRTMVPKRFRDRLAATGDTSVYITNAPGRPHHLDVRPASLFEAYYQRVSAVKDTPRLVQFKRFYFGSAVEVDVDSAGRILVPVAFRQRCGLSDRISFVGVDGQRFEIWAPEALDRSFDDCNENAGDILEHLAELGV